jgi:hypothetical protein
VPTPYGLYLPPGARATRNAKTACSAVGRSGTVRTEAMPQHRDAWTMVWQTQVTDALGHQLSAWSTP